MKLLRFLCWFQRTFFALLKGHFKAFWSIDPLADRNENLSQKFINHHYMFAIIESIVTVGYGIFILEYEGKSEFQLDQLQDSPFVYRIIYQIKILISYFYFSVSKTFLEKNLWWNKKKPTVPSVPRWSPSQVLTRLDAA